MAPVAEDSGEGAALNPVSESLEGLVGALDKLKQSLGYGDEFALVEQHISELQQENEELRQFAEEAIMVRCCRWQALTLLLLRWLRCWVAVLASLALHPPSRLPAGGPAAQGNE